MKPARPRVFTDSDTRAVRRASLMVGLQIMVACAAVVIVIVLVVFLFVISEIRPVELFERVPDPTKIDINALKLLRAAVLLGVFLVVLAGVMSWLVTRRAVRPLGEALRIQRAFVADASHELRTPLTVLDARLQVLQRALPVGDPSVPIVVELRNDARSLIAVVNDLLESAEVAGPTPDDTRTPSDLLPIVELAVNSMRLVGEARGIRLEVLHSGPAFTHLPASRAHRCTVALLDNALRFAPDDSIVSVEIVTTKSWVSVTVRDHGPGIVGIEPSRIFDRFARSGDAVGGGGSARTGFGIGLALVRDIVSRYGGSVAVVESSPAGSAIGFTLVNAGAK